MRDRENGRGLSLRMRDQGQGLLELAILLPVLLVIAAGILDLGRAYMVLVALNDAAAEGAAYAAIYPTQHTQIQERASDASNALVQLEPSMVTVAYTAPPTPGMPITVTIEYNYTLITPVLNAIVPGGVMSLRAMDVRSIMAAP